MIELTEANNNSTITVNKGDKVNIYLPTNPSTGYSWTSVDNSAGTLDRVQHDSEPESIVPGRPTHVRFLFTVQQSGYFRLNYAQPWNITTPPTKMFEVNILVN